MKFLLSFLFAAIIFAACYVDFYEPGTSSSSPYSSSETGSYSSSSRSNPQPDSLQFDNKNYKIMKMGSQTWFIENLNAIPSKGNWWCHGNFEDRCKEYGRLYDWEAANAVCPDGWKLPSKDDFDDLLSIYGNLLNSVVGWNAAFGGWREEGTTPENEFKSSGAEGFYWSSTGSGSQAYRVSIAKNVNYFTRELENKKSGLSVRCIKK